MATDGQVAAIDIGTSGIRGQLLDAASGEVVRTCMTTRNPIPGANVMDHLSFALEYGEGLAHRLLCDACSTVLRSLRPTDLRRIAVCGNPIQLSVLEGTEIRDLAYAGENKRHEEGVGSVDRTGHFRDAGILGYPDAVLAVPPAVRHEIGADALAMMVESGFLDDDMCMVTDYGTNAEMALKVGDRIYTGSAAAGPAMEGQQIRCGMLAGPGAVSDMVRTPQGWLTKTLDDGLEVLDGPVVNLRSGFSRRGGAEPVGITGTGVVAMVYALMQDDQVEDGRLRHDPVAITRRVSFGSEDFREAGKAIGAIRAGHLTLMLRAGIDPRRVGRMYMCGASGTYVDPVKAQGVGLIIPGCRLARQIGNTSLELACDLVLDPSYMDDLNGMRDRLLTEHTMFASSDVFRDLYTYEYGYWNDGMPASRYERALERYGVEGYLEPGPDTDVVRVHERDIGEIGDSLEILDASPVMIAEWNCGRCMRCVRVCPEKALGFDGRAFSIRTGRCLGTACRRCQESCPEHAYDYSAFRFAGYAGQRRRGAPIRSEGPSCSACDRRSRSEAPSQRSFALALMT